MSVMCVPEQEKQEEQPSFYGCVWWVEAVVFGFQLGKVNLKD